MPAHPEPREATVIVAIPALPLDGTRCVLVRIDGEGESFVASPGFMAMGAKVLVVPVGDGWVLECIDA